VVYDRAGAYWRRPREPATTEAPVEVATRAGRNSSRAACGATWCSSFLPHFFPFLLALVFFCLVREEMSNVGRGIGEKKKAVFLCSVKMCGGILQWGSLAVWVLERYKPNPPPLPGGRTAETEAAASSYLLSCFKTTPVASESLTFLITGFVKSFAYFTRYLLSNRRTIIPELNQRTFSK
jgi:hypothetical protein